MMLRSKIANLGECLRSTNQKAYYLAILRIALSIYVLKELFINALSFDVLYSSGSFVYRQDSPVMEMIRTHYMLLIIACFIFCLLNIAGIGRWITALLLLVTVSLLYRLNDQVSSGGDAMLRLVLGYMVFANSYDYFVWRRSESKTEAHQRLSNLVSNLAAYSIMLQLCIAYFCSAIGKLHDPTWIHGQAIYYALLVDRYTGTSANFRLAHIDWLTAIVNYGTLVFECTFPFLIWCRKFRKPLLMTGVLFHLCLYIFLMIYGFQVIFLLIYGLFLTNEQALKLFKWIKR